MCKSGKLSDVLLSLKTEMVIPEYHDRNEREQRLYIVPHFPTGVLEGRIPPIHSMPTDKLLQKLAYILHTVKLPITLSLMKAQW